MQPTQKEPEKCYYVNSSDQAAEKCVEDNSLTRSDLFKGIIRGFESQLPLNMSKYIWTEDPLYWIIICFATLTHLMAVFLKPVGCLLTERNDMLLTLRKTNTSANMESVF